MGRDFSCRFGEGIHILVRDRLKQFIAERRPRHCDGSVFETFFGFNICATRFEGDGL